MDLSVSVIRDADTTRFGDTLEPRGNIHTISEYVAVFDDYVTDVDANAELDAFVLRYRCVTFDDATLDLTAQRVASTALANSIKTPSPVRLTDPAAILGDFGF